MRVFKEVAQPTNGVLKKRITESNQVLITKITGRIVKVGSKVWTTQGTFKIRGGAHGKVFVEPMKKAKGFTREVNADFLDMEWVQANSMSGGEFEMTARMVEAFQREAIKK